LDDLKVYVGDEEGYFQQRRAPEHCAKAMIKFLQRSIDLIPHWPPNSPDLWMMENLSGILKGKIAKKDS
jgi:hypothetical protein